MECIILLVVAELFFGVGNAVIFKIEIREFI